MQGENEKINDKRQNVKIICFEKTNSYVCPSELVTIN